MKNLGNILISIVLVTACLLSCSSEDGDTSPLDDLSSIVTGRVEFFVLKSFNKVENGCLIIDTSIVLSSEPLLNYSDIVSYSASTFTFKITKDGALKLRPIKNPPVSGVPFALVVNGAVVYTGYFWPSYSNYPCEGITIDPSYGESKQLLMVKYREAAAYSGTDYVDKRNAPVLIQTLKKDKKLIQ
jgi:hypothetical protein